MRGSTVQSRRAELWRLVDRQHGVISRGQLRELGFSARAVERRIAAGRLHVVRRAVYAVGRPRLTRQGRWMAAVLGCGRDALLSHWSAAALWEMRPHRSGPVHVSVPARRRPRQPGVVIHRRGAIEAEHVARCDGIPVTSPIFTLVDIAARLDRRQTEAAINEADKRDLIDPEALRSELDGVTGRRGLGTLREVLDVQTFTLTDSELERRFLPLARAAGLPAPATQRYVNGFRVDFYWPHLGLVVETDGLRYHRTPTQQRRDRLRDQAHAAAGLTPLRFTHDQVRYEPGHVRATLVAVACRLEASASRRAPDASRSFAE